MAGESALLRYRLVNPSDPYEVTATSREVACLAALLLGEGRYALAPIGRPAPLDGPGGDGMPLFLLSKEGGAEKWWLDTFGRPLEQSCADKSNFPAIADAMESVASSLPKERRSSLNDIGSYAAEYAARVRAAIAAGGSDGR